MTMPRKGLTLAVAAIASVFMLSVGVLASNTVADDTERWTVEETLGVVLDKRADGLGYRWDLYVRSNLGARQKTLSLLENEEAQEYWPAALRVLGYIGDDTDTKQIQAVVVGRLTGLLDRSKKEMLRAYCDCMGLMARRGSANARNILDEITTMEYWRHTEFKLRRPSVEIGSKPGYEHEHAGLGMAFQADALSNDETLEIRANKALESMDPIIRRYMREGVISPEVLGRHVAQIRAAEIKPVSAKERSFLGEAYRDQIGLIAGTAPLLSNADVVFVSESIRDAVAAHASITAALERGKSSEIISRLLDDGKLLNGDRLERLSAELEKDLGREAEVFKLLAERDSKPIDFVVRREMSYQAKNIPTEEAAGNVTKSETITVTFRLSDSAEIGNVLLRRQRGSLTVTEDGTLVVVMKKIDGEWHWNPFGW